MIHSVFELGDTIVREVMVPRSDVVYIERYKNLRQTMSLFLRSGFSRVPVDRREPRLRRRHRLPQGHRAPRLRGARRGVHPAHRRGDAAGATSSPSPSGSTPCSRRCRPAASTSRSSSTSTAAPPAWSPSRTCSRRSSARSPTSTTRSEVDVERLDDGSARVSSRYPIDDLDELFGVDVEEEDVDSRRRPDGQAPRQGADPRLGRRGARAAVRGRGGHRPPQPASRRCWSAPWSPSEAADDDGAADD